MTVATSKKENIDLPLNKKKFDIVKIVIIYDSVLKIHPAVADETIDWLLGTFEA